MPYLIVQYSEHDDEPEAIVIKCSTRADVASYLSKQQRPDPTRDYHLYEIGDKMGGIAGDDGKKYLIVEKIGMFDKNATYVLECRNRESVKVRIRELYLERAEILDIFEFTNDIKDKNIDAFLASNEETK